MKDKKLIAQLVKETIDAKKQLDSIKKNELQPAEALYDSLRKRLQGLMEQEEIKKLGNELGEILYINKKGRTYLDTDAVMADLGVDTLAKYQREGNRSQYLQVTVIEPTEGEEVKK